MSSLPAEQKALAEAALAHQNAGRFGEAAQAYVALLSVAPQLWPACYNLGLVYQHLARLPEAADMYARAVRLNPQLAEGYNNLGNVLKALKNDDAAIEAFEQAMTLNPQLSEAAYNLATMMQARGQLDASIIALRQAVAGNPSHGNAWDALYRGLLGLGRQEEAIQAFTDWERLAPLTPELVTAGLALCRPMGDRVRETRYLGLALSWPFATFTPEQFSPVLGMIPYFDVSRDELLGCYRRYDAAVTAQHPAIVPLLSRRAADSRLRIGYVSGDFRQHVMGRMMRDVIARHDRSRVSVLLISTCARTQHDAVTAEFRQIADGFADIADLDDFAAAKIIAEADIDILIDLAGHTNTARPGIYAHRPARSIVTHLGYHGCLGMSAVDYKLTDRVADLVDAAAYQIERPLVLETGVFPMVRVIPSAEPKRDAGLDLGGKFVFGAFLNLLKLSPHCLDVWRRVLDALPESILLFSPLAESETAAIERVTGSAGIDFSRVAILNATGHDDAALRARYRHVHAVMDTFPYAGGDTTLAALDMGVPVVTLAGQRHSERIGASILTHLGVPELIADSDEAFIAIAVRLARDAGFMAESRQRIATATAAAAANEGTYTHALEKAFIEVAAARPAPSTMNLTARQFFQALHGAMRRQAKADDDGERRAIATILAELRIEQPHYPPLLRAQIELAHELKDLRLASECLAALLEQSPEDIDARLMLAGFLIDQGGAADALKVLEDASAAGADLRFFKLQTRAFGQLRQWQTALSFSEKAVERAPADAQALFWHGTALSHVGDIEAALTFLNRALILAPDHAEAAYNAGVLLAEMGNPADAEKVFRRVLGTAAAPSAHLRLLQSLRAQGRRHEWLSEGQRFMEAYPGLEYSQLLEGRLARYRGDLPRESEVLVPLAERVTTLDDPGIAQELVTELLAILPYHDVSPRLLQRLRARYAEADEVLHSRLPAGGTSVPSAPGRLKLGYLVDFSLPFVPALMAGLVTYGNRERYQITIYSLSPPSATASRPEMSATRTVSIAALDESRAAEIIRTDGIDVLLDVSSFGTYAKPGLLSYRPAPLQMAMPGFSRPAGIGELDYRLTDRWLDVAADTDSVRPAAWLVNEVGARPILPALPGAPPLTRAALGLGEDVPVFGVLASVEHVSSRCVGLWKSLSERVPEGVFLLNPMDSGDVIPSRNMLVAGGIEASRVLSPSATVSDTGDFVFSGVVDMVLDTLPGSDYRSVRAAILAGIPAITLPGRMPDERVGFAMLSHLGETATVAETGRDYVDIAATLAADREACRRLSARIDALWQDGSRTGMPLSMECYVQGLETAISGAVDARLQRQIVAEA